MTREETARIMAYLKEIYPNGKQASHKTVEVWYDLLREYDFTTVKIAAIEAARTHEGYTMPTPATLIRHIKEMTPGDNRPEKLWHEALKMIRKGTVLTEEEFQQASEPIRRYFGGASAVKDIALLPAEHIQFEKGRFMRDIGRVLSEIETQESLPGIMKNMIANSVEQIEGGKK